MRTMHTTLALLVLYAFISSCRKPVVGCTDSTYRNFNPDANEDDGCCCTITYGPNDRTPVELDQFAVAVPNVPDTITPMPMIELEARAFRMDQSATGPCGCLTSYWLGGLYNQPYASHYGHAAMRSICETQFYWYGKFLPYPTDTAVWNAVAAANGVDSWPALRINSPQWDPWGSALLFQQFKLKGQYKPEIGLWQEGTNQSEVIAEGILPQWLP